MADSDVPSDRSGVIASIKTPLGFFVLAVLVAEGVLIALVAKADGTERTIAIVGMVLVLLAAGAAVCFLAFHRPEVLNPRLGERALPVSLTFDEILAEISSTIEGLEANGLQLAKHYRDQGDLQRLLDGLYSGLLYASGAVPTGSVSPVFYGNLMDWDGAKKALRVRYVKGPYNDEIITRSFPLSGPRQGVASEAVSSGAVQCYNTMDTELKEKGESRLQAMVSIPAYPDAGHARETGSILAINIDSVTKHVFPDRGNVERKLMEKRGTALAACVRRVNALRSLAHEIPAA